MIAHYAVIAGPGNRPFGRNLARTCAGVRRLPDYASVRPPAAELPVSAALGSLVAWSGLGALWRTCHAGVTAAAQKRTP